jgi:hypothetical protein
MIGLAEIFSDVGLISEGKSLLHDIVMINPMKIIYVIIG